MRLNSRRRSGNGLFLGLLVGGAIGATIALLYAPEKGRKLRSTLSRKAGEILDDAGDVMHEASSKASHMVKDVRKRTDHLLTDAQKKANTVIENAEKIFSNTH